MNLVGRTIANRYVVREIIGRGGSAVVYEALDTRMTRPVAIKVPIVGTDPSLVLRRFRREVRACATVAHPNVCGAHDAGLLDDGTPYLVAERLEGENLGERLRREGSLSLERAIAIFSQVLSALSAAHARRIVHRDIKPSNIFLSHVEGYDELVKVLDFGASKRMSKAIASSDDADTNSEITAVGFVVGTPPYMAPEQIRTKATDPRIDIFACGVTLFEALTGERLYKSRVPDEIFQEILTTPARTVRSVKPSLPSQVDGVVQGALRRNPDDRYPTAASFQKALKSLAPFAQSPESTRLVSTQESARARRLTDLKQQFHELAGRHRAMREMMSEERAARQSNRDLPSVAEDDPEGTATTERRNIGVRPELPIKPKNPSKRTDRKRDKRRGQ